MKAAATVLLFAVFAARAALSAEGVLLDAMDAVSFTAPKEKGRIEQVDGREGKALKFIFDNDCRNVYFYGQVRGTAEWDKAAGFSFWVKGDGSDKLGGIEFVWNEDYALRYAVAFPISSTEWTKVTVAWRDLIPETPKPGALWIDPKNGNAPSKLGRLSFGKWWYWKDYGAHSYTIDDIRLEAEIKQDTTDYTPKGAPLARVLEKLRAGKPITIVTMGDSLTDYNHWANRETNWPTILSKKLQERYGSQVTIVNPAIGGTELRGNLVLVPRWAARTPEPDLVTICFGYNDWESGMRGPMFLETCKYAVDLIRRVTKGKADILIITTNPAVERWDTMAELAQACRDAAAAKNAGIADTFAAFHAAGKENKERLYCSDKTHLGAPGHELVADTVAEAIIKCGGGK
jgi:lysophospholipase L1-like esterase